MGDVQDVVDSGGNVIDMIELGTNGLIWLDFVGPGDDERISGTTEVGGDEFCVPEGRASCPGPAGVIHVVGDVGTERGNAPQFFQGGDLLFDRVRDLVLCQQLADGSVLTFCRRAVVAPDEEHEGVLSLAQFFHAGNQATDLRVSVFDVAREDLHQA